MPDVFVIMGDRNTRKSSTIRALTGIYQRKVYQVALRSNVRIDIFVHPSSLQEVKLSPPIFINQVNQNNYNYILVSLWISPYRNFPNGMTYIGSFIQASWNIRGIVILGSATLPNSPSLSLSALPQFIPNSSMLASNEIASQIRNWWQWL